MAFNMRPQPANPKFNNELTHFQDMILVADRAQKSSSRWDRTDSKYDLFLLGYVI